MSRSMHTEPDHPEAVVTNEKIGRISGDLDALDEFAEELLRTRQSAHGATTETGSSSSNMTRAESSSIFPERLDADEATIDQGLAKLVLTLIEILRQVLEKQAIRRIDAGSLTDEEVERLGNTFMKLAERMDELKEAFGLEGEELDLNLGRLSDIVNND